VAGQSSCAGPSRCGRECVWQRNARNSTSSISPPESHTIPNSGRLNTEGQNFVSSLTGLVQFLLRLPRTDVLGYSQPSLSGLSAEFSRRLFRLDLCSALNGPTKLTQYFTAGKPHHTQ
jgi:hypothetical protein